MAAPAALPGSKQSEAFTHDATGKAIAKLDRDGQLIKFSYDESTYQPTALKFTAENTEVGLTYKAFEKDEKTFQKPTKVSGEFGELTLAYTTQGRFKGTSNDGLMDVFAAALGAKTRSDLVDMLSYAGKEIPEPDPCMNMKGEETPEDDKTPPDGVMDAWARLSAIFELFSTVDTSLHRDSRFTGFLSILGSDALTDIGITSFIGSLSSDVLVDSNFANGITALDIAVLENEVFRDELKRLDDVFLKSSEFAESMLLSEPKFSESGKLIALSIIGGEQALKAFAFVAITGLINANGVARTNADVEGIVQTYFYGTAPGDTVRTISPNGFIDNSVTQAELDRITEYIKDNLFLLESARNLVQNPSLSPIITSINEVANELSLPDEWFYVSGSRDDAPETIYQKNWKFEGLGNVPGFLAGGVGRGGQPPASAVDLLDYRAIDREGRVRISLLQEALRGEIDYNVTIGETFDFEPGGGGYDDFREEVSFGGGIVSIGVEQLKFLEKSGLTVDVPFRTVFTITKQFVIDF